MSEPETQPAEPVFTPPQVPHNAPSHKPEQKPLPPQFVVPPEPKTPFGKLLRAFANFKNNLIIPNKIKIWAPRIAVIVITLSLIIVLVPFAAKFLGNLMPGATPTPVPEITPEPTTYKPSPYANDEVVLAIEKKIDELEAQMKIVDFREDTLSIPSLDWNISF